MQERGRKEYKILVRKLKVRDHLKDLSVDTKIILKRILRKLGERV
jgi:hypothetical protein